MGSLAHPDSSIIRPGFRPEKIETGSHVQFGPGLRTREGHNRQVHRAAAAVPGFFRYVVFLEEVLLLDLWIKLLLHPDVVQVFLPT